VIAIVQLMVLISGLTALAPGFIDRIAMVTLQAPSLLKLAIEAGVFYIGITLEAGADCCCSPPGSAWFSSWPKEAVKAISWISPQKVFQWERRWTGFLSRKMLLPGLKQLPGFPLSHLCVFTPDAEELSCGN